MSIVPAARAPSSPIAACSRSTARRRRFALASVHPGHTVAEVIENTGFAFDRGEDVPTTPAPSREDLRVLRTVVAPQLVEVYPQFAAKVFGVRQTA